MEKTGEERLHASSKMSGDNNLLLPGFRFYPTEEELISFYLHNKLQRGSQEFSRVIPVVHIYDHSPWDLPTYAGELCRGDPEQWFFFFPKQEREGRTNRLTREGYWKATGSPLDVYSSQVGGVIGRKRTMVFYLGRAPCGRKTQWKMNEYKATEFVHASLSSAANSNIKLREEFSLCRLYKKSKCVRSFDRRPYSPAEESGYRRPDDHIPESTTTGEQNCEALVSDILTCSLNSSSSQRYADSNQLMDIGYEPLWREKSFVSINKKGC